MSKPYTVIGVHSGNGQIVCHQVFANDGLHAFAVVACTVGSDLEMVVALNGHQNEGVSLTFPGNSLVDCETILEQRDVFGDPAVTTVDEPESEGMEIIVRVDSDYEPEDGDAFEAIQSALDHFEIPSFMFERKIIDKPRVVVCLDGGIIQGITSNVQLDYLVYDYDIEGCSDDDVAKRPSLEDGEVEVFASSCDEAVVNAEKVAEIFKAVAAEEAQTSTASCV